MVQTLSQGQVLQWELPSLTKAAWPGAGEHMERAELGTQPQSHAPHKMQGPMAWTQGTCLVKAARHGLEPPGSMTPRHSPTPSLVPVQLVRAVPGLLVMATGQAGQLDRFSSAQSRQRTRWHRVVCSAEGPHQRTRAVSAGSCRCWRWAAAQGRGPHCGCRRQGTTP